MTWIDVFDSAVKIGLGALITATSTYLILRKTHRHEFDKEVHMHQLKYFEEKKIKYIEFLSHSQMLVQKYRDRSCNAQEDDYISYLKIYNEIQVISEDKIRIGAFNLLNAVNEFIVIRKDEQDHELLRALRKRVDARIGEFQYLAREDVTGSGAA